MIQIAVFVFVLAALILIALETLLDKSEDIDVCKNIVFALCAFLMIIAIAIIDFAR